MINDVAGVMSRALADRYFSAVVEVTDPVACNRTRADYNLSVNGNNVVGGQGACAPIPPRGQKVATLRQTPNDVWNECYLGRWLLEGGVAWDTYDSPLLGDEQPCLVRESPWDGAQNGTSPALPKVSTLLSRYCPIGSNCARAEVF